MWMAIFFNFLDYILSMNISSACLSDVPGAPQDQKDMSDPLELKLVTCLSCHVLGAGTL